MKAVVFDMDGLLFDTERICMESWVHVAKKWKLGDMEKVFPRCIGLNANDTKELVLQHYGQEFPYEQFRKEASRRFYEDIEVNGLPLMTGVREILGYLNTTRYRIGLASSSRYEAVVSKLEAAEIGQYFSVIVTGDMVEHSKPQPDIYLLACRKLGVAPEEAYALEDSPNGIRAAHRAGMKPIMVPDMIAADAEMETISFKICKDLLEVKDWLAAK